MNNLKKCDLWNVQITRANNFISSIDKDEELVMHSRSNNIEIMINDKTDKFVEKNLWLN